jgi:hypothetical protein
MSEQRKGRTDAELARAGLKECVICHCCWALGNGFSRHYNSCKDKESRRLKALESIQHKQTGSGALSNARLHQEHSRDLYSLDATSLLPTSDFQGAGTNDTDLGHSQLRDEDLGLPESNRESCMLLLWYNLSGYS